MFDLKYSPWPPHALMTSNCIIWPLYSGVWPSSLAFNFIIQRRFLQWIWLFDLQICCLTSKDIVWPPKILFDLQRYCLASKDIVFPPKILFSLQRYCFPSKDIVWPPKILFDLQRCCLTSKDIVWPLFKLCSVCRANNTEKIGNMTINCEDINVEGGPNKTSGLAYMSAITIGNNKHTSHNGNMKSGTLHLVWLKLRRVCGFEYNLQAGRPFLFPQSSIILNFLFDLQPTLLFLSSLDFRLTLILVILSWFPTKSARNVFFVDRKPTLFLFILS